MAAVCMLIRSALKNMSSKTIERKDNVREVAEQVFELFQLVQEERRTDIFLDFLFSEGVHKEPNRGDPPDCWRFRPEIMTFILYVFCPHERVIGEMLSPSRKSGISQPAVSKRLRKAVEIIAERYGCPTPALLQELIDAKKRVLTERELREIRR